jgi:hypothetical protein
MSRLNHRTLLAKWDTIIMQLCDEVCTHDVLSVIDDYLSQVRRDCVKGKMPTDKIDNCRKYLRQAIEAIDPES